MQTIIKVKINITEFLQIQIILWHCSDTNVLFNITLFTTLRLSCTLDFKNYSQLSE